MLVRVKDEMRVDQLPQLMGDHPTTAVQLDGGYGLVREYDVERFYRDYKLLTIGEGTSKIQQLVIARLIGAI